MRLATLAALLLSPLALAQEAPMELGSPPHREAASVLAQLLQGDLGAAAFPMAACDNAESRAPTLAGDAAFFLAALNRDAGIEAACAPIPGGGQACQALLRQSIPGTEIRWLRGYRFERRADGTALPASLACFTVP